MPHAFNDYANIALLLVTTCYIIFTIKIWKEALRSNELTRQALDLQRRTFEQSQRPAIHVASVTVKALDAAASRLSPITAVVRNEGGAAHAYKSYVAVDLRTDRPSTANWPSTQWNASESRRLTGAEWQVAIDVADWPEWRDQFVAGNAELYFFHTAVYRDGIGRMFRIRTVHALKGLGGSPVWPVVIDEECEISAAEYTEIEAQVPRLEPPNPLPIISAG